jgi:uncharacterized protein (UPF0332 family)
MANKQDVQAYLDKAIESLAGAESELANRRFNNCANRCYYACFQAAVGALLADDVRAYAPDGQLRHEHVHAQFVGLLINRRKRYPSSLRRVLSENQALRNAGDYELNTVSEIQAHRAVRRSGEFVHGILSEWIKTS